MSKLSSIEDVAEQFALAAGEFLVSAPEASQFIIFDGSQQALPHNRSAKYLLLTLQFSNPGVNTCSEDVLYDVLQELARHPEKYPSCTRHQEGAVVTLSYN
jgi:hypothetical protein